MTQRNPQENNKIIPMPSSKSQDDPTGLIYSTEAEEALLGRLLMNPADMLAVQRVVKAEDFFWLRNHYIFAAMERLASRKEPITNITVGQELKAHGHLNEIGGQGHITHLLANVPLDLHTLIYAELIKRASLRRDYMLALDRMKAVAADESINIDAVMENIHAELERVEAPFTDDSARAIEDLIHPAMDNMERAFEMHQERLANGEAILGGIPTGIDDLDKALNGLHKGRVIIVAALTGVGKTGFLATASLHASSFGLPVLFANCGDGTEIGVIHKLTGMETGIPPYRIETGQLTPKEYERAVEAMARITARPLFIMSNKGMTPKKILLEAKAIQQEHGLAMVAIDYIQRMEPSGYVHPATKQLERMQRVSRELINMAPDLNVPVVVGAQINRAGFGKDAPTVHHIKDCGNIGEDADVILILHRPGKFDKNFDDPDMTQIVIGKNRVTGVADKFIKTVTSEATGRFYNYTIPTDRRHVPRLYQPRGQS